MNFKTLTVRALARICILFGTTSIIAWIVKHMPL
jgi:hypothetical protein